MQMSPKIMKATKECYSCLSRLVHQAAELATEDPNLRRKAIEEGQKLLKEAMMLDPHFSKATGAPDFALFTRPDEISKRHRYLLRPF